MTAALEGGEWSAACPGRTLPPGKTRYPLYRRLGGPQGRSGRAENLVPTGIRSRTFQPVVSHYNIRIYIYIYIYIYSIYITSHKTVLLVFLSNRVYPFSELTCFSINHTTLRSCWHQLRDGPLDKLTEDSMPLELMAKFTASSVALPSRWLFSVVIMDAVVKRHTWRPGSVIQHRKQHWD